MAIVRLERVVKTYALGKTEVHALRGVSFGIEKSEFMAIVGPSGSGKSTILNLIGCIDAPTSGRVVIKGSETSGLSDRQLTLLRHKTLGFIFQSFNLIPVLNVFENIEFPLLLGRYTANKVETKQWIDYLISALGLGRLRAHKPSELSGGQRQRVAIARALVTKPDIVLADEPTANLDSHTGKTIIELMRRMNRELNTTFVFSTHDKHIFSTADRIIRLLDGVIVEDSKRTRTKAEQVGITR